MRMDRIDLQTPQMQIKAWDLANWDKSNHKIQRKLKDFINDNFKKV